LRRHVSEFGRAEVVEQVPNLFPKLVECVFDRGIILRVRVKQSRHMLLDDRPAALVCVDEVVRELMGWRAIVALLSYGPDAL